MRENKGQAPAVIRGVLLAELEQEENRSLETRGLSEFKKVIEDVC